MLTSGNQCFKYLFIITGSPTPKIKWHVPNITFEESIKSAADVIENK